MKRNNFTHKHEVTRRSFLKAAGISIALPMFGSFRGLAATSVKGSGPMRIVCISSALGMHPASFFPKTFGKDFDPSPVLEPLKDLRSDLTVFSHMDHPAIFTKHGSTNSLLSGVDATKASAGQNVSMDQVAAAHTGYKTRFPSVHISLGGKQGASWSYSGIKVREESNPMDLFHKLFVNDSEAAKKERALELDQQGSVLDLVRGQAKRLEKNINRPDKEKLDEYLTAIREAEEKIQGLKRWENVAKTEVDFDNSIRAHSSLDYGVLSPLMFDLLFLAIQSDVSRVFTAGYGIHNRVIELDGVSSGYHSLSHHGNLPQRVKQLQIIEKFYISQMARFVQKLKDSNDEDGPLLDKTMVFFGSGLSDASRHSNRNLPLVLAGGGFKHQGHIDAMAQNGRQTPLNNLFTSMLQNYGVETESFNRATGAFSQIHR